MSSTSDHNQCPLAAVDQRLEDAHQQWHQAEAAYFEPDEFRRSIQTAIQTLRTVTFVLQNNKRQIPDFEKWYAQWQERLKADKLMRWLVAARNRIEKEGDLSANSVVRAAVVASYLEEGPQIEVPAEMFTRPWTLIKNLPEGLVGDHLRQHGTLQIERKWVEGSLPEYEILDALSIAYGKLAELVDDAHRQIGLPARVILHKDTGTRIGPNWRNGRLPCMLGHDERRIAQYRLSDGTLARLERKSVEITREDAEKAKDKYNIIPGSISVSCVENYEQLLDRLFETARAMFLKDGYHVTAIFLLRDKKLVRITELRPEDQSQKYLMMRTIADDVTDLGIDAVIQIGEAWNAPADPNNPYMRPAHSPDRTELLMATMLERSGSTLHLSAEILRTGDQVTLGQTVVMRTHAPFSFAPILMAWGKDVPQEWLEMEKKLTAAKS